MKRIANGAGVMLREVEELIKQYVKFSQVKIFWCFRTKWGSGLVGIALA